MRTSAATLHSWRHEFGSFGIVKKRVCVGGGGGGSRFPQDSYLYLYGWEQQASVLTQSRSHRFRDLLNA